MNILVVGSGGREHAIIKKIKESPLCERVFCAPGNGGISVLAECFPEVKATDVPGMVALAQKLKVDFVIVAPDDPLVLGMVDAMEAVGIPAFGPSKAAARIEGSKVFSKAMMKKYGVPTAAYEAFSDAPSAIAYTKNMTRPLWIKADGLALGKGAVIARDKDEASKIIKEMMEDQKFGASGSNIVIEEDMQGPEVTVLCLTDGKTIRPLASSMDHKRALDDDKGLNTGGMGTIAPSPLYTEQLEALCMESIFRPTVEFMQKEGCAFKGCLYVGLMLTEQGPKVIEYNCRFGDPETQVVLPLLDGDLLELMLACRNGNLDEVKMEQKPGAAACVVLASGGYPGSYETNLPICGLDAEGECAGVSVIHAGTKLERNRFYTAGGRVLGLVATGDSLKHALTKAYAATCAVHFSGCHFRRDIGKKAVESL